MKELLIFIIIPGAVGLMAGIFVQALTCKRGSVKTMVLPPLLCGAGWAICRFVDGGRIWFFWGKHILGNVFAGALIGCLLLLLPNLIYRAVQKLPNPSEKEKRD